MVRVEIRYLVDITMLIVFILCAVTGFILWFVFPSGARQGQLTTFLGIAKHDWVIIHDYSSLALTVAIIIHFVINFKWILQVTRRLLG